MTAVLPIIETDAVLRVRRHVELAALDRKIVAICGPSGTGKTTSALDAGRYVGAAHPELTVVRYAVPHNPSPKTFVRGLLELVLTYPVDGTLDNLERLLEVQFRERPYLVLVDEAQHLNVGALERTRALWERHPHGIVLIGDTRMMKRLANSPQLTSRIARRTNLAPLTGPALCAFLAELDVAAGAIGDDALVRIDRQWAHGNLRRWAEFFTAFHDIATRLGLAAPNATGTVDAALIDATLAELG